MTLSVSASSPGDEASMTYTDPKSGNVITVTVSVAAGGPAVIPPGIPTGVPGTSGFGGAEPSLLAGGPSVAWQGYTWETQNWGTAPGQPKAVNVLELPSGLSLSAAMLNGTYAGSEIDSARGDQGITGNGSTWGYGTYQWTIDQDLTLLPPELVLGLFTFWAQSKGGPAGQKEIDIEFYSAGTIAGAPAFVQFGYYQDTGTGTTQSDGHPGHVLVPGSQFPLPAGLTQVTAGFTWLPGSITWFLDEVAPSAGIPLHTVTATQGQSYTYTQPYGGNQFSGTVQIPATGKQQVIANLWCPNGTAPPNDPAVQVPLTSFIYTPA